MNNNIPPVRTNLLLDSQKFQNAAIAAGLNKVVFLAGPYIETEKRPRKNTKNRAALLRFILYHSLDKEGVIVTLGEYTKLIEATVPLVGDYNDSALAEYKHAQSSDTDAVVILPSSPGSFLELGAFATEEDICKKMLIIVDAQYRDHKNYMNSGPLKAAGDHYSEVHFIDYSDHDQCLSVVNEFLTKILNKKAKKQVYGKK